ncbi:MAG: two-partner secretion domain-containing protein, partial [Syntrophales bacterium]
MEQVSRHKRLVFDRWLIVIAAATLFAWFPLPLLALPLDGQVSAGSGSISQTGSAMTVRQDTPKLSINWREFGISANESMRFYQPSASAIALNRILGQDPSRILGSLSANGQVFILNPNGVIFGRDAQVNVGGLVASSLSLSDKDFLAGRYTFQKGSIAGDVVNMGSLSSTEGGYIALLAPTVRTEGTIKAPKGTVALAAGERITLNLNNGGLLDVAVEKSTFDALAENRSLIQADGGTILLSAGGRDAILDGIVNNTGIVRADSVSTGPGGIIRLESRLAVNTGTLSASGTNGGNISILAHNVLQAGSVSANGSMGAGGTVTVDADHRIIQTDPAHITANGSTGGTLMLAGGQDEYGGVFISGKLSAQGSSGKGGNITLTGADLTLAAADLNASGPTQGGGILIGGDYQGKNAGIPNAQTTYITNRSTLTADATQQGDGGRVIVWSDEATTFGGSISARGAGGGQGGFVEVSGHDLHFAGDVQARTLLLDPANITISA